MGQAQVEAFLTHMAIERKDPYPPTVRHSVPCFLYTRRYWGWSNLGLSELVVLFATEIIDDDLGC
jgi:hypothetical protein